MIDVLGTTSTNRYNANQKRRLVVALKRSATGTGYSGVANPLFSSGGSGVRMLYGDAGVTFAEVMEEIRRRKDEVVVEMDEELSNFSNNDINVNNMSFEASAKFPQQRKTIIGILREEQTDQNVEKRVAIVPTSVKTLSDLGFFLLIESNAGAEAGFRDEDYVNCLSNTGNGNPIAHSLEFSKNKKDILDRADIILKLSEPTEEEIDQLVIVSVAKKVKRQNTQKSSDGIEVSTPGKKKLFVGAWRMFPDMCSNDDKYSLLEKLRSHGFESSKKNIEQPEAEINKPAENSQQKASSPLDPLTICNLSLLPRVSSAQPFDIATHMARITGYRAVLDAFSHLPKFAQRSSSSEGAARVLIVGCGVAGLQAIAAAKQLGAEIDAFDVREACKEQAESLGANFLHRSNTCSNNNNFLSNIPVSSYDIIITTVFIPTKRTQPVILTKNMVDSMKRGSVIVDCGCDFANRFSSKDNQQGESESPGHVSIGLHHGNCEYSVRNQIIVTEGGVTVVGKTNYVSDNKISARQASAMVSDCVIAFLKFGLASIDSNLRSDEKLSTLVPTFDVENFEMNCGDHAIAKTVVFHEGRVVYGDSGYKMVSSSRTEAVTGPNTQAPGPAGPVDSRNSMVSGQSESPPRGSSQQPLLNSETNANSATISAPQSRQNSLKLFASRISTCLRQVAFSREFFMVLILLSVFCSYYFRSSVFEGYGKGDQGNQHHQPFGESNTITVRMTYFCLSLCLGDFILGSEFSPANHTPYLTFLSAVCGGTVFLGCLVINVVESRNSGHPTSMFSMSNTLSCLGLIVAFLNCVFGFTVHQRMIRLFS